MNKAITSGSGNAFKDPGFENPSEHRAKADLALQIINIVEERNLTQEQAAKLVGATQPDISRLKGGRLRGFTLDRLFSFLLKLDRSIEIRVTKRRGRRRGGCCNWSADGPPASCSHPLDLTKDPISQGDQPIGLFQSFLNAMDKCFAVDEALKFAESAKRKIGESRQIRRDPRRSLLILRQCQSAGL